MVQKSPKGTTRDQFIKNDSTAVEKTLKKNKVSPDVFKQVATNVEDTVKKQAALLPLVNSKNVLNFATQTIGEGTGELVGEYAVTGELDVPGAIIESIVATPASMADVIITNVYSEVQSSKGNYNFRCYGRSKY